VTKQTYELARLNALRKEEERKAELEEDDVLLTYSRDDAHQVKRRKKRKKTATAVTNDVLVQDNGLADGRALLAGVSRTSNTAAASEGSRCTPSASCIEFVSSMQQGAVCGDFSLQRRSQPQARSAKKHRKSSPVSLSEFERLSNSPDHVRNALS